MTLSILHRATGVAMTAGLVLLTAWFVNVAAGAAEYERFAAAASTLFGRLVLIGWSFAFFYHLANGIRHLVWDTGRGFEKRQANASAWFVIIAAVLITAGFWTLLS